MKIKRLLRVSIVAGCSLLLLSQSLRAAHGLGLGQPEQVTVLPHFLDGQSEQYTWQTVLVVQNQAMETRRFRFHFFDDRGEPLNGLQFRNRHHQKHTFGQGQNDWEELGPAGSRSYRSTADAPLTTGYCIVRSGQGVLAHARIRLYDSEGTILSEVILPSAKEARKGRFYADLDSTKGLGMALVNLSETPEPITCIFEAFQDDISDPIASLEVVLDPPQTKITSMLCQLLKDLGYTLDDIAEVQYSCDQPVGELFLHLRGLVMHGIEVIPIPEP